MASGYPWPRSVRWELFDMICAGMSMLKATKALDVSRNTALDWWRNAGAMTMQLGGTGGLAITGKIGSRGDLGHWLTLDERITIQHGLDTGQSITDIGGQGQSV